ncbi:melanopsin-A-like [Ptychodera flava]|uniref:melanopsin-A-like n=1 Tax=Ptychodera flava TaxID=63121 RepID=UPI00396A593C
MDNSTFLSNASEGNISFLPQETGELDLVNSIYFLTTGLQIGGSFLFALMIILALLGNACVCCVIYYSSSPELQLITSLLLVNLAISDLLIGSLGMPLCLISLTSGHWVLGKALCEITGFLGLMFSMASTLTVACISIDRYCAIVHPLDYLNRMTPLRAKTMMAFIWICPGICALMPLVGVGRYRFEPAEFHCTVDWEQNHAFSLVVFLAGYALPLFVMLYCYYHMFCAARSQARRIDVMPQGEDGIRRRQPHIRSDHIKAVRILCLVIGIFILSWTPYAVLQVCQISMTLSDERTRVYVILSTYMVYANSVINPYIYTLLYRPFRRGMRNLLRKKCCFEVLRPKPSSAVVVSSRFLRRNARRLERQSFFLDEPNYTFDFSSAENIYINNDPTDEQLEKEDFEDSDSEALFVMHDENYPDMFARKGHQPQTLLHEAVGRCHVETLSLGSPIDSPLPSPPNKRRRQTRTSGISRKVSKSSLVKKKLKRSTSVTMAPYQSSLPGEIAYDQTLQPAGYVLEEAPRRPTRKTLQHFVVDPYSEVNPGRTVYTKSRISLQHEPCASNQNPSRGRYYRAIPVFVKGGNDDDNGLPSQRSSNARFSRHRRQDSVSSRHHQARKVSRVSLNEHLIGPSRTRRKNSITSTLSYNLEISDVVHFDVGQTTQRTRDEVPQGSQFFPGGKRRASCSSEFNRRGGVTRVSEETEVDSDFEVMNGSTMFVKEPSTDQFDYSLDDFESDDANTPTKGSEGNEAENFTITKQQSPNDSHQQQGRRNSVTVRPCIVRRESLKDVNEKRLDYRNNRQRVSFSDQPNIGTFFPPKGIVRKEDSEESSDASNADRSTNIDISMVDTLEDLEGHQGVRRESIRPLAIPPDERHRRQSVFKSPFVHS